MNEEFVTLGKRAVASRNWRWMPGMLALRTTHPVAVKRGASSLIPVRLMGSITDHEEVAGITLHGELLEAGHVVVNGWHRSSDLIPDLTDPATLGCLLALVRGSWGMPTGIIVRHSNDNGRWEVSWSGSTHGGICGFGATEAEALVMALESVQ